MNGFEIYVIITVVALGAIGIFLVTILLGKGIKEDKFENVAFKCPYCKRRNVIIMRKRTLLYNCQYCKSLLRLMFIGKDLIIK